MPGFTARVILKSFLILLFLVCQALAVAFLGINLYTFTVSFFHPEKFGDFGPLYNMFFASLSISLNLFYVYVIYYVISHCFTLIRPAAGRGSGKN